ncbi:DUF499 domain-containing protein [Alcanivorax sp. 1008]|uniref:DUF499 domain-containing protein n=1 Tax=Alcanivorax sp. 1008 TaxID=2816853 RepID=UPI001D7CBA1F|nr:DUF499 domain-containing protein [Alcanivorax sp. 1008]MCC1497957.1 DUF499 domain-containing protein [Alcanivorax sp. 1008]
MLGLKLRQEFTGKRLSGTTISFTNSKGTGALDKTAKEFLDITYPSVDLLKTIEAVKPGQSRPVLIAGSRGQGKSHLMAAVAHMLADIDAGNAWCKEWASSIGNESLATIELRSNMHVITQSMELQKYKYLWDLLFDQHPHGAVVKGIWEHQGDSKTEVPGYDLIKKLFEKEPTLLIIDEFQTWYEGLTNNKQYPRRTWAFNFIQILSQIAEAHPELLTLVVSVRDGASDAAQQMRRVNPVTVDFKGPQAKQDRQRLLLYRIFENRLNVPDSDIAALIKSHLDEFLRLNHISGSEHEKKSKEFIEAWPYSPELMQLLDDQVLIATDTQETRDLLRILVDVFKTSGETIPVITAADFSLTSEKSGVAALLDSVANQMHRSLREKALRNKEAVEQAVKDIKLNIPHLEEVLSSLWLRSLSLETQAGAEASTLQVDITRSTPVDDNQFQAELALIEENSFNIHRKGSRLVFLNEENPQAKLMANAKNDKLFENEVDLAHLADEIRYALAGAEGASNENRVIVLKRNWDKDPWSEVEEKDQPTNWDKRIPVVVVPSTHASDADLGKWLKQFVSKNRNTVRFLLPKKGTDNIFYDKSLIVLARSVYLSNEWKRTDTVYSALHTKYQKELRDQLKQRFDRFAILDKWNFAEPEKCAFLTTSHNSDGAKILGAIQDIIKQELFIPEEMDDVVKEESETNRSVYDLLERLKEPMGGGNACIPWLGETETKERIIRICAQGKVAINLQGRELLEKKPGETEDDAWNRMKGRLGQGRALEETTLHSPGSMVSSGGGAPQPTPQPGGGTTNEPPPGTPAPGGLGGGSIFGGSSGGQRNRVQADATSALSLLGKLESWGVKPGTPVHNMNLNVNNLTGAQLEKLLKGLPDGITYALDMEKEDSGE